MRESLADFCHREHREELLAEWDTEKNLPLTPETVSRGSKHRVWWTCAHGHHWQAAVHTRSGSGSGTGCPYCSGRFPIPGENDLATKFPLLAQEWNTEKNGDLTPDQVLPGSHRIVWWRCAHGHQWRAQVKSRVNGSGCPVCTNRTVQSGDNDLATQLPTLAKEWHPTKNGALTPDHIAPASNKKVWWICDKGHEYQAVVSSRTQRNGGCPYCANKKVLPGFNDLATLYPHVASQWHPTLNRPLTPDHILPGSRRKVWWQCKNGHIWQAVVYSRTGAQNSGCPFCTGYASGKRRARYERMLKGADVHPPDPLSKEERRE